MAKVTAAGVDPYGVPWAVYRRGYALDSSGWGGANDGQSGEVFPLLLLLLILWQAVVWPFWFIAHWLGVRWVIVIERDGKKVTELVRGWGRSQRRIQEIAESAAAGTLQQFPPGGGG